MAADNLQRRTDPAGLVIAGGLFFLAALVAWNALGGGGGPGYSRIGPNAASFVVAAGLALLGIGTIVAALRGSLPEREPYDLMAVCLILGGLLAMIAILTLGGGFVPGVTLLFALTARAFGRRALVNDIVIGLVLGILIYVGFTKLLSLSLPQGPLEHLL